MTPAQQAIIVEQSIQGASVRDIAPMIQVHPSTVARARLQPEAQAQIAKIKAQLLDQAAQQSADNIIHVVQNYKAGIKEVIGYDKEGNPIEGVNTQLRDHGYKASVLILQSTGLLPHTQGPTLVQINNNVVLSPALERIMKLADSPQAMPIEAQEIVDI